MTEVLPLGWTTRRLGDLVATKSDIVDGPFGSNLKSSHYTANGARVVRLQNIGYGSFVDADAFISLDHYETLHKHNVLEGDLMFASLGERLPRTCLAPNLGGPAIVKADCIRVRLAPEVNRRFVLLSTLRPTANQWAQDALHGLGRPRLGLGAIRQFPVPWPPLDEQHAIVERLEDHLSRLDAVGDALKVALRKAEQLRKALLRDTFSSLAQYSVPLASLLEVSVGGVWGDEPGVADVDVHVLRVTELRPHGVLDPATAAHRSVSASQLASRQLKPGDLLLEKSGGGPNTPVGRVGLVVDVRANSICSNFMQLMRPDLAKVIPEYLHLYLTHLHNIGGTARFQTATTNIRNIKASDYMQIAVPVPELDQQREVLFATKAQLIQADEVVRRAISARRMADQMRRSLLHSAFAGELTKTWREKHHG